MLTTNVHEIADGVYRLSTFVPEVGPDGFTFNQFLLAGDEPDAAARIARSLLG